MRESGSDIEKNKLLKTKTLICLLLAVALLLVYRQVVHFPYTNFDDELYVTQNVLIQKGMGVESIASAFRTSVAAHWHPLTLLSFMFDYDLYGLNAGGYHFTNLVFHIINTLLLFLIFSKMTGSIYRSFFVAALFGLHPLHVESVAWISERKDVLSTFWTFLTIWAYAVYARHPDMKRYALVIAFFVLGLMSKVMVVTLPFVLLLLDYWPIKRSDSLKNLIVEKIPLFGLSAVAAVVAVLVQKQAGGIGSMDVFPLEGRVANALISYVRYIGKMFWPFDLSFFYPHPGMWPVWQILGAGIIIVMISILIGKKSVRFPYLPVGWLWYLGTLVPVIGLVQSGGQAMADRYSYLSVIGLFLIIAWGVPDLFSRLKYSQAMLGVAACLILISFSFLSWQRCQLWNDNAALWDDVIKKNKAFLTDHVKNSYFITLAYHLRGMGFAEKGDYRRAIADYNTALSVKPVTDIYYNRGLLYLELGKFDLAIRDFTAAVKMVPAMADAWMCRGIAFGSQKTYDKALADFNQALKINPGLYQAYFNRGIVYEIDHQDEQALADFRTALSIKPDQAQAHSRIGMLMAKKGKSREAVSHVEKALQIEPNHSAAAQNLWAVHRGKRAQEK